MDKEFRLIGATGKDAFPVCDVKMMFRDRVEAALYILKNAPMFSNWCILRDNVASVVDDEGYIVADVYLWRNDVVFHDWNRG